MFNMLENPRNFQRNVFFVPSNLWSRMIWWFIINIMAQPKNDTLEHIIFAVHCHNLGPAMRATQEQVDHHSWEQHSAQYKQPKKYG